MTRLAIGALALAVLTTGPAYGFGGDSVMRGGPAGFRAPEFLRHLFPPRLVLRHQDAIELTDTQRERISADIRKTQKDLVDVQWDVDEASAALARLLDADTIDVDAAMAQAAKVMALEQRVKEQHLRLLIEIRNVLTPAQRERLEGLREERRDARRERFKGGPPPE